MENELERLAKEFARYNKGQLVALAAGAHLIPENHSTHCRLDYASLAALLSPDGGSKSINGPLFTTIVNEHFDKFCSQGRLDDPNSNLFTENIVFHGGNFTIYPGIDLGGGRGLQSILNALFIRTPPELQTLADRTHSGVVLLLSLSDLIAKRLGHKRNIKIDLDVPNKIAGIGAAAGRSISSAVVFNRDTLNWLASLYRADSDSLTEFYYRASRGHFEKFLPTDNPLSLTPLVPFGDGIIFAMPATISIAIHSYIHKVARELKLQRELSTRQASFELIELVKQFAPDECAHFQYERQNTTSQVIESIFQIDLDKLMVCFLPIGKTQFDPSAQDDRSIGHWISRRIDSLHEEFTERYKILWLVMPIAGGQHPFMLMLDHHCDAPAILACPWDVRLVLAQEEPSPLALFKFAALEHRIREKVEFAPMSDFTDKYAFYLKNGKSFYFGDEHRPDVVSFAPGSEISLLEKGVVIPDLHLVIHPISNRLVEVIRIVENPEIPIFGHRRREDVDEIVVELSGAEIWLSVNLSSLGDRSQFTPRTMLDSVSYWIWRLTRPIRDFDENEGIARFLIRIEYLATSESIETDFQDEATGEFLRVSRSNDAWILGLSTNVHLLVGGSFDHILVLAIARILSEACQYTATDALNKSKEEILRRLDEDPSFRKTLAIDVSTRPELMFTNLLRPRLEDDHDINEELDGLGDVLEAEGFTVGPVPDEAMQSFYHRVVAIFRERALKILRSLNKAAIVRDLLEQHESVTWNQSYETATRRFTRSCYWGDEDQIPKKAMDGTQHYTRTALAIRTALELVISEENGGTDEPTWGAYDRLIALCSLIVKWGRIGDEFKLELVPHQFSLLDSGRIGLNQKLVNASHESFFASKFQEETELLSRTIRDDGDLTRRTDILSSSRAQIASVVEFGLSLQDLGVLQTLLFDLAISCPGSVAVMDRTELIEKIATALPERAANAARILESFSLDFKTFHDSRFRDRDRCPWRYGRPLSVLRRPLIGCGDGKVRWGARTVTRAFHQIFGSIAAGNFKGTSSQIQSLVGEIGEVRGDEFVDECFGWIQANFGFEVHKNVTIRPNGDIANKLDLGDIDILVVDKERTRLLCLECKATNFGREPYQVYSEIKEIEANPSKSWVAKHSRRDVFLQNWTATDGQSKRGNFMGYKVESLILTSEIIPSTFFKTFNLPIISFTELQMTGQLPFAETRYVP